MYFLKFIFFIYIKYEYLQPDTITQYHAGIPWLCVSLWQLASNSKVLDWDESTI